MQLRCGIVEDDIDQGYQLERILMEWSQSRKCNISVTLYLTSEECLSSDVTLFEVLFLDIKIEKKESGVALAQELRLKGYEGDIIFQTGYSEFVFEGYSVHALEFLVKPVDKLKLMTCMDQVLKKNENLYHTFSYKNQMIRVLYKDIIYIQSSNHSVEIVTTDNRYLIAGKLQNYLENVPEYYCRIHRTLIVNMYHVDCISKHEVTVTNRECLPVSKTYAETLKEKFIMLFS